MLHTRIESPVSTLVLRNGGETSIEPKRKLMGGEGGRKELQQRVRVVAT